MADSEPIRSDYRFMRNLLSASFAQAGVTPTPAELDRVTSVFRQSGGSWERVFQGSVADIVILKKTIKAAIDSGLMTKTPVWGG